RIRAAVAQFRKTEVEHFDRVAAASIRLKPYVVRFQIAMDDPVIVRFADCRADLIDYIDYPRKRQSLILFDHFAQRAAVKVLHNQISDSAAVYGRKSEIGDVDDVRMAKASCGFGFAFETLYEFGVGHKLRSDDFERDRTGSSYVGGKIYRPHSALTELLFDSV